MSKGKSARPYQNECVTALRADFRSGLNRLAIVLPTGAGKGYVIGMAVGAFRQGKVLCLANSWELMQQMAATIREMYPHLTVGFVKGAEFQEYDADVVIASIASMSPERCEAIGDVSLVLIDECHYAAADSWMRVCNWFGCFDERTTKLIGFTATFVRNDDRGLGDLFQKVSFQRDLEWAIRKGFVLRAHRHDVDMPALDLRNVKRDENGEYDEGEVGALLEDPQAASFLARLYLRRCAGRRTILFAPTKGAAHAIGQAYTAAGITNAVITGDTSRKERAAIFAAGRAGEILVYVNVGVLIAGFDDPGIECVIIATMTKAESRLTQMVGRCMRLDPANRLKTAMALIIKGVEAQVRTSVELKRTGMKPPEPGQGSGARPVVKMRKATVDKAKYRARVDAQGYLVVHRIVGAHETLLERRKVPLRNRQQAAETIIKIDQLRRSAS